MAQKILKVGSSLGVTIPRAAVEELGLKLGDRVTLDVDKKTRSFRVATGSAASEELVVWTRKFIERYRPALEALAKK